MGTVSSDPVPSRRRERRQWSAELRAQGCTWVEVAQAFTERYRINPRVAFRLVRGWSQRDAASQWNTSWPDDPKTFKNFSYWEQWPAATGYAPSLDVLSRLAQLYQCSVSDLVADVADFRHDDPAQRMRAHLAALRSQLLSDDAVTVDTLIARLEDSSIDDLAAAIRTWTCDIVPTVRRQSLMLKLSSALSLGAAAVLAELDQDDQDREPPRGTLSGLWASRYAYHSSGRGQDLFGEHEVRLRHHGGRVTGHNRAADGESRLRLDLSLTGAIATGTWTERTSRGGYYRGAVYHGTLQLIVSPQGRSMSGRWLGFDKEFKVNTGEWHLDWLED
jgi:predicted DNA-binding ribbon-helix-helix protein